jgi:hypothetical protein
MLTFRRVSSVEEHNKLVSLLTQDVLAHGGSASETVDMHGHLWEMTVCQVPWGTLLLKREVSHFEAWVRLFEKE